ncbi:MAG: alpha/beta fold hydrolase [Candidatus Lindowbacteria bacterium]|nr:alpha/beta fold hydrolase [Candidatus Lindowbacteria bacterium]
MTNRAAGRIRSSEPKIIKGYEPYSIGSGRRACLLVHGIAGSPAQMRGLAEALAASGIKARGTLLPGHGTHPNDLDRVVWQDWYEHVHEEYRRLKSDYEDVSLIGFSIGAAISAHYAAHSPVDRLVLLSVPLCPLNDKFPTGLMLRMYGAFFRTVKGRPEKLVDADGEPFSYVYDRVPTAILHTMSELIDIVRDRLHRIYSPVLIIQSQNDKVSGSKSGPLAYRSVSSPEKRLVMLKRSGHSIMMDVEQDLVFREVIGFLKGEAGQ